MSSQNLQTYFKSLKNEVISYGGGSLCKIYTEQDIIEDEIDTIEVMEETLIPLATY